jgi:hypothetical protein
MMVSRQLLHRLRFLQNQYSVESVARGFMTMTMKTSHRPLGKTRAKSQIHSAEGSPRAVLRVDMKIRNRMPLTIANPSLPSRRLGPCRKGPSYHIQHIIRTNMLLKTQCWLLVSVQDPWLLFTISASNNGDADHVIPKLNKACNARLVENHMLYHHLRRDHQTLCR